MVLPWGEQPTTSPSVHSYDEGESISGSENLQTTTNENGYTAPDFESPINFSSLDADRLRREFNMKHRDKIFDCQAGQTMDKSEQYDEVEKFYEENLGIHIFDDDFQVIPKKFSDAPLDARLLNNCEKLLRFSSLNALQVRAIPAILGGRHLLVEAPTGIGKTASFMLPAIQKVIDIKKKRKTSTMTSSPYVLVLNNTRHLAAQSYNRTLLMLGISDKRDAKPIDEITAGLYTSANSDTPRSCDIAFGTMGKLRDKIDHGELLLDNLALLIIDEADKMVDMCSFGADVEYIYDKIGEDVASRLQVCFFSATYIRCDEGIILTEVQQKLLREKDPNMIQIPPMPGHIDQRIIQINSQNNYEEIILKMNIIKTLIDMDLKRTNCTKDGPYEETIGIFCETVKRVNMVTTMLQMSGYNFLPLSRTIDRRQQTVNLKALADKNVHGIVATNIMARGIDVSSIKHIIIMEMSSDFDMYRHRIGRTGRAGHGGMATVLINLQYYMCKDQHVLLNLTKFLHHNNQFIPPWLEQFCERLTGDL